MYGNTMNTVDYTIQEYRFKIPFRVIDEVFYLCFDAQKVSDTINIQLFITNKHGYTFVNGMDQIDTKNITLLTTDNLFFDNSAIKKANATIQKFSEDLYELLLRAFRFGIDDIEHSPFTKKKININQYKTALSVMSQFSEELKVVVFFVEVNLFSVVDFLKYSGTFQKGSKIRPVAQYKVDSINSFYEAISPLSEEDRNSLMNFQLKESKISHKIWTSDYCEKIIKDLLHSYYKIKKHWFIPIAGDYDDEIDKRMLLYINNILYSHTSEFTLGSISSYLYTTYIKMGLDIKNVIDEFNGQQYRKITKGNNFVGYITDSLMKNQNSFPVIRSVSKKNVVKLTNQYMQVVDHPIIDGEKYRYKDIYDMRISSFLYDKEKLTIPNASILLPDNMSIET